MEQRSDEWFAIRCGKATGSRIADIVAKTKTGYGASRANYAAQLVAERLTGKPAESFSNAAMQWGTDTEPMAREAYEMTHGGYVEEVGFLIHPSIPMTGASPDGLIGEDGMLEIKCPNTATHIEYLLGKVVPNKYKPQMTWQMLCAGRKWCDFVSFDPRMPERHQLFCIRYEFDAAYAAELEAEVVKFLAEVAETVAKLEAL
jgi:putative phage-type endonuclease